MQAFYSGVDDASDVKRPGLHMVVGRINMHDARYEMVASIVQKRVRYNLEPEDIVDTTPPDEEVTYHPKVETFIKVQSFRPSFQGKGMNKKTGSPADKLWDWPSEAGTSRVSYLPRPALGGGYELWDDDGLDAYDELQDLSDRCIDFLLDLAVQTDEAIQDTMTKTAFMYTIEELVALQDKVTAIQSALAGVLG